VASELTVVKCGGALAVAAERICVDVAALHRGGERVVLAHGGTGAIGHLAERLRVPLRTLRASDGTTSRHSDPVTVAVVTMAMVGMVKPRLVLALAAHGVPAAGLTGLDAGLVLARRKAPPRVLIDGRLVAVHDDYSGRVTAVDPTVLHTLLDTGIVPVVSPPAASKDGTVLNVDADRVAAAVAVALGATRLALLTDTPGLLRDADDAGSLISRCELPATGPLGTPATGGMRRKLIAARQALLGGVGQVVIGDSRREQPLVRALTGVGTTVCLRRENRVRAG
jgi:acetylglutamate/LysW-gamma-L-alpha-aminoadipate kinase